MVHVARGDLKRATSVLQDGAAVQDRQRVRRERFPALGLHWLLGLVRLAQDDYDEAIDEFTRERALAQPYRLYGREYTMHSLLASGAALLRAGRRDEAEESFLSALDLYPEYPLIHAGMALAAGGSSDWNLARSAAAVWSRSRDVDGGVVSGVVLAASGDVARGAEAMRQTLDTAPPGFAGWWLPVEPFLRQVAETAPIKAVLSRLAERAR
jgi:tetratricopeptide (TPR) repeat protein